MAGPGRTARGTHCFFHVRLGKVILTAHMDSSESRGVESGEEIRDNLRGGRYHLGVFPVTDFSGLASTKEGRNKGAEVL